MKVVNAIAELILPHWEPALLFGHLFVNTKKCFKVRNCGKKEIFLRFCGITYPPKTPLYHIYHIPPSECAKLCGLCGLRGSEKLRG